MQVLVPFAVKDQISPAPVTATFVTETLDPPAAAVLVSVTLPDPVSVPEGRVIENGLGLIATVALDVTPVPEMLTGVPVMVAPVYATANDAVEVVVVVGAYCTLMVQEAPTARATPQLGAPAGNVPVVIRENGAARLLNVPPASAVLPVLVTVRLRIAVVPVAKLPKANGLGLTVAERGATPVPVKATGELTTPTPAAVIVTVPVAGPVAVGVKTTLMVQEVLAARVAPQVPPNVGRAKGADTTMELMVVAVENVLVRVRVLVALVVETTCAPNARDAGVTVSEGGAMNSIAPTSTAL